MPIIFYKCIYDNKPPTAHTIKYIARSIRSDQVAFSYTVKSGYDDGKNTREKTK